jgi:hypothetical protein
MKPKQALAAIVFVVSFVAGFAGLWVLKGIYIDQPPKSGPELAAILWSVVGLVGVGWSLNRLLDGKSRGPRRPKPPKKKKPPHLKVVKKDDDDDNKWVQ